MQIIVLGMHRSGTSPLTRIINLMGVYVGTEGTLMSPHQDNPKGFWERNDVYALHQETLKTMGADWDKVAHLDLGKLTADQRAAFDQKARNILQNLDAHRPWVLKDPRLCLLMPLWRPFLETPICVHIYRSPIQVAQSLRTRNGFPIHFGVALWEKYNLTALTNSGDLPRLFVSHQRLLGQPLETVRTLYEQLLSLGVHGLRLPSEKEILAFLDPALYRERGDVRLKKEFVSFAQEEIFQAFEEGTAGSFDSAISLSAGAQATLESYETNEERERQRLLIEETLRTKEAELTTLHQKMTVVEQNRVIEEQTLQQQLAQAEQKRVTLEASRVAEAKAWKQQLADAEQQLTALEESKIAEAKAWKQQLADAEQKRVTLEASRVAEANAWKQQLAEAEQKRVTLEASRVAEANAWKQQLAEAEQKRVTLETSRVAEANAWKQQLADAEQKRVTLEQQLAEAEQKRVTEVSRLERRVNETLKLVSEQRARLSGAREDLQVYSRDIAKLVHWIDQLDEGIEAIFQSKRWKLGHTVSALFRKIRFKPPLLVPQNFCSGVLTNFHTWQDTTAKRRKFFSASAPLVEPATAAAPAPVVASVPPFAASIAAPVVPALTAVLAPVAASVPVAALAPMAVPAPAVAPTPVQIERVETLVLPEQASPVVSIIIPVYNQWAYTYACLKTIIDHTRVPYEVIIADDVSTDETQQLTRYVKNVVWVRNSTNLGFTLNCNNAARQAKGEYLLFLNNDITVQAEWLDAMLEPMRKDDKVGLVGAKLVYPDGKLQEAGGIIWNDASGRNYGRQQDPDRPEYNYLKEVDYCTGACILVRASLWKALGGFDPQFAPAYYEDTDLAFGIRQLGYKVVYQPRAVVVHFEGVSHGRNEKEGLKSHQVKNKEKFHKKWRHVLQRDHFKPGDSVFLARDRASAKGVILVIDHRALTWDKDAGSKATYQYIKLFAEDGYKVIFVSDNFRKLEPYTTALQQLGVEVLYGPWYNTESAMQWLRENGKYLQYVVLNRPNIAEKYIDAIKKWTSAQVLYYAHDLHWLRAKGEYETTKSDDALEKMKRWEKTETHILTQSDVILLVSHLEVDVVKRKFPQKKVRYVPLVYHGAVPVEGEVACSRREGVLFVGGAGHPPNVDAVRWYVQEIHPLARERIPTMSFYVCGERMDEVIQTEDQQSVKLLGYVSDEKLAELYRSVRVVVAPLRYGGGVKGKILEALEYGVPVVTTTVGAQGLPAAEHILLTADTPAEFVEVLHGIYTDESAWTKQATAGLRYMREHFSPEVMRAAFVEILDRHASVPATLPIDQIRSYAEYQVYAATKSQEWLRRADHEKNLIPATEETFEVSAYCYVCQRPTRLKVDFRNAARGNGERTPNWRERLVCPKCELNNRRRAALHLFEEILRPTKESRLYITEQSGTLHQWLARNYPTTIGSEYLGDAVQLGEKNAKGVRNEDLTKLSFADAQFDAILSFDVLEHIPNVHQALRECFRVLKPRGALFFSVPFVTTAEKNIIRATVGSAGEITHLLPAEYHGDPVRPDGVLAFYHFGWELLEQLRAIGFADVRACFYWSDHFGYLGKEQLVLIAGKGDVEEKPKAVPVVVQKSATHNGVVSLPSPLSMNTRSALPARDNATSVVCLLGMGRSGTSLVASLCQAMGVYLGEANDMVKANKNNPKGYWENGKFTAINHQILLDLELEYFDFRKGQTIDSQELIRKLLAIGEEATWKKFIAKNPTLFEQAVHVITTNFADRPVWGWKDPRSSLTLEFWRKAIAAAYTTLGRPYQIKYILCNRNLSEVTGSLGLDGEVVRTLWSYSTSSVLKVIAQEPFVIVDYGRLIGNEMEENLKRIYHFLHDTNLPQAVLDEGKAIIDPDLYRVRSKTHEIQSQG